MSRNYTVKTEYWKSALSNMATNEMNTFAHPQNVTRNIKMQKISKQLVESKLKIVFAYKCLPDFFQST